MLVVGNGEKLSIKSIGSATIHTNQQPLKLKQVLHVPEITKNLLSVSRLTLDNQVYLEFHSGYCLLKDKVTGRTLLQGNLSEGLYQFHGGGFQGFKGHPNALVATKETWHRKLGHPSSRVLDIVLNSSNIKTKEDDLPFCESCQYGKSHKLPFQNSQSHAENPLDLIHTDVWGPAPINSTSGFHYYIHFIDDYSRYTWIYPLRNKFDALSAFLQFKTLVQNQYERKIKYYKVTGVEKSEVF